jgi:hypothetical protein
MRAKKVYENIRFERGQDPKDVMEIGGELVEIDSVDFENFKSNKHGTFVTLTPEGAEELLLIATNKVSGNRRNSFLDRIGIERNLSNVRFLLPSWDWIWFSEAKGKRLKYNGKIWKIPIDLKESVEFQRGEDPKSSMNIGERGQIEKAFKDIIKQEDLTGIAYIGPKEDPKLLVRGPGSGLRSGINRIFKRLGFDKYLDLDPFISRSEDTYLYYPIKPEYEDLFKGMNLHWRSLDEGLEFERGANPKEAMGIGIKDWGSYVIHKLGEKEADKFFDTLWNVMRSQSPKDLIDDIHDLVGELSLEKQIEWADGKLEWWEEMKEEYDL